MAHKIEIHRRSESLDHTQVSLEINSIPVKEDNLFCCKEAAKV